MKFVSAIFAIIPLLIGMQVGFSQGFVNLNFESTRIVPDASSPYYPFAVAVSNALPGWTLIGGAVSPYDIVYNTQSLGAAAVSIHDTNDPNGDTPLAGHYSVLLQGSTGGTPTSAAIAQTGQIPFGSVSLMFFAVPGGFAGFQVAFSNHVIPLSAIGSGANYTIYGGDISAYAGQVGEIRFTTPANGRGFIDNIQFSNQPIPERSSLALFGVGVLLVGFFRGRNSSR